MFTLFISMIVAAGGIAACLLANCSPEATVWVGLLGLMASNGVVSFLVRKRMKELQAQLQGILQNGQRQMNRKIQQFQMRPGGNLKQIQRQLEGDQKALISEALVFTDRFEPFKKWSLFMDRQISTMRMQFLYQLKKYEEVDQLLAEQSILKKPLMMEPMAVAMKMARQYKNDDLTGAEKTFKWHVKWFRGSRGRLLYALMSWIYVQQKEFEKARQVLIKAKEATGDETIARNLDMLSNNKDKHFSNAGLGDEWFGLYLEKPPAPKQQRVRPNARGGRRF